MVAILYLIEQIATGLYVLLAVGIFFTFRRWSRSRLAYRMANFDLVRDIEGQRLTKIGLRLSSLIMLAVIVVIIQVIAVPYLRSNPAEALVIETPEEPAFVTPTPQSPVQDGAGIGDVSGRTGDETAEPPATSTITSTPPGTIIADAPPPMGCESPGVRLEIPANGMYVFETIDVIGTANTPNFGSYKLELSGGGTADRFAVISESSSPIEEPGVLGQFNPAGVPPGMYQFRLTVFDTDGMLDEICVVNISIGTP